MSSWVRASSLHCKRRRLGAVSEMGCTLLSADVFPRVSVEAAFEDILQSTPRSALDTAKKIVKPDDKGISGSCRTGQAGP